MILINTNTPFLKVYVPASGDYVSFVAGKLEIDEGDVGYDEAMAEAKRNPSISIMVNETTCRYCGEVFTGKAAAAQLGKHKKDIHFEIWQAEKLIENEAVVQKEIKSRAGYACDVCQPVQTFGDEGDLSDHVKLLHTAPPPMDDEGNEIGTKGRPGEAAIPAATRSGT